jgi:hypothetical protein
MRQVHAYLDAESRRKYDAARERWDLVRLLVSAQTGQTPDEYPAYPESEEDGYDAAKIEAALSASPMVRRAPAAAE